MKSHSYFWPRGCHQTFLDTRFFSSLDGLRCLAILGVIWVHTGTGPTENIHLLSQGVRGVDLFFAISGFLITTLLLRERDKLGDISLRDFYIRRSLRIFPIYYTVIFVYIGAVWFLESDLAERNEFFSNLPYFLTYTSNWFVNSEGRVIFYFAWTLATEEQFYLFWPTIEKYFRGWKPVLIVALILVIRYFVIHAADVSESLEDSLWVRIIRSIHPAILGGVASAHVLHDRRTFEIVSPLLSARWAAPVIFFLLLAAMEFRMPIWSVWTLMVLLVGSVAISESNGLGSILRWKPIAFIGVVSYGIYLLHMLSYNAVKVILAKIGIDHEWIFFPATLVVVTIVSAISYRYYESWFLRLKSQFTRVQTRHPVDIKSTS